jgi:predicted PurR-regulated permease PerM
MTEPSNGAPDSPPEPTVDPVSGAGGPAGGRAEAEPSDNPQAEPWRQVFTIGFILVFAAVVLLLVAIYRPFWKALVWASALAILVYPAHKRLRDAVGGRSTLAAGLSTAVWILVFLVPSAAVVNQLATEAVNLWPQLIAQLGADAFQRAAQWAETSPLRTVIHLALRVPESAGAFGLESQFRHGIETLGNLVFRKLSGLTLSAPGLVLQLAAGIVAFFFFLREGPGWGERVRRGLPLAPADSQALIDTASRTVGAVFRGVLLTALAQAMLATLGYLVVKAPVPALLGLGTFFAALLPFVGAAAVWAPTAIGLFFTGHRGAAIGLAIWGALVVSLVDNFLRPYLIGRETRLPLLWLFLAIMGGLQVFGLTGLVLGPASLALFLACWRIYQQQRAQRR